MDNKDISIKPFLKDDIPSLYNILSNENTVKYLPIDIHSSIKDTEQFYERLISNTSSIVWKIIAGKEVNPQMAGIIDLTNIKKQSANLAYIIGSEYTGKGIATSAIGEVLIKAFDEIGIKSITAPVVSRNIGSKKVLEKHNFVYSGTGNKEVYFDGVKDQVLIYILECSQ